MQTVNSSVAVEAIRQIDDNRDKDESISTVKFDPWNPPLPPPPDYPDTASLEYKWKKVDEYADLVQDILTESRATNIITPERTPKSVIFDFCDIQNEFSTILKEDCVQSFLNLFKDNVRRMTWGLIITAHTFTLIVAHNALRCAKVALEGKSPDLRGYRANPNYVTSYGFFPIHYAASKFSVDMINLLLDYGASANLRTAGEKVIDGLLPLHVAVDDTCLHKYLEDNLLTYQKDLDHKELHVDYIYKIIHLLCLPEMKIFLDTVRLLAKHTDNVVEELWNYIKDGKLAHTAVLLLAAHQQLCNRDANMNGFDIIKSRIFESNLSLEKQGIGLIKGKNRKAQKMLKEKKNIFRNMSLLVGIISQAGEAFDSYIQTHSEVHHHEVFKHISSVLNEHGYSSTGKGIDVADLCCCPFDFGKPKRLYKDILVIEAATESTNPNIQANKEEAGLAKKEDYRMFIPYWRSVLSTHMTVRVVPFYASKIEDERYSQHFGTDENEIPKIPGSMVVGYRYNLGLLGRGPELPSSRRLYGTAALTLLKMLKRA